jgi:hypothetical protein
MGIPLVRTSKIRLRNRLTMMPVVCRAADNTSVGVRSKNVGPAHLLAKED